MRNKFASTSLRVLVSSALVLGMVPAPALAEGVDEAGQAVESLVMPLSQNSDYIVDWTECGTCEWPIDSNGALVVRPANGATEGQLPEIPWSNYKGKVRSVKFEGFVKASTLACAFQDMAKLEKVDLTGLDSSGVDAMYLMFSGCSALTAVDVSSLDTSSALYLFGMFKDCSKLTTVNLSGLDFTKVDSLNNMFDGCSKLIEVDLSGVDASNITSMSAMFYGCSSLTSLSLKDFNSWAVTDMSYMFYGCSSLTSLDLSGFDTSNTTDMSYMFMGCSSLVSLDISGFDTSIVRNMGYMFYDCSSLASIELGSDFSFFGAGDTRLTSLPSPRYGCWKSSKYGNLYTPETIPNNVADTYVAQKQIEYFIQSIDLSDEKWTGSPITKYVELDGLTEGVDYSIEYSDNTDIGTATIAITGMGDYSGTLTYNFNIVGPDYTCSEDDSSLSIDFSADTADDINWSLSDTSVANISSVNASMVSWGSYQHTEGTVQLVPLGAGYTTLRGYVGSSLLYSYLIQVTPSSRVDISDAQVTIASNNTYTGDALTPKATVKVGEKTLAEGSDYDLSYWDNVNAGTGTVSITGKGGYKGSTYGSFEIAAANASKASVTAADQSWTGEKLTPNPTVTFGGRTLENGVDYDVSYSKNTAIGTAAMTVNFKGNYTGTAKGTFKIVAADASKADVSVANQKWTGKALTPAATVTLNGKTLKQGTDYTLSYSNNTKVGTATVKVTFKGNYTGTATGSFSITEKSAPSVTYQAHVQNIGWQTAVKDGATAGTSGQSLRVEALRLSLSNSSYEGQVQIRSHVQDIGWQDWSTTGGTTGQSKRVEAMQLRLTGDLAERYDIYYRVHAQNFGWMGWAKNGEKAGTEGYSLRLEAIQVKLVPKGGAAPGSTAGAFRKPAATVEYQAHVQDIGWQSTVSDGATAGTSGRSLRVEALKVSLAHADYSGSVQIRAHVQDIGWQGWSATGGTSGQSKRVEALQIRLTGEMANHYDVYYRVHAQNIGWMGWAKNGEKAGTEGKSLRLEAIQVKLVPKGSSAPGSTANCFQKS